MFDKILNRISYELEDPCHTTRTLRPEDQMNKEQILDDLESLILDCKEFSENDDSRFRVIVSLMDMKERIERVYAHVPFDLSLALVASVRYLYDRFEHGDAYCHLMGICSVIHQLIERATNETQS